MSQLIGITILSFLLAGCAASGERFQDSRFATESVADDKGRIIFYRESDANFRSVTLGIDDSPVGTLAHKGFIVAETPPGEHRISAWVGGMPMWQFAVRMPIGAGETCYIRVSHRAERMLYPLFGIVGVALLFADTKGEFQLEQVPAAIARVDLAELRLSE